MYTSLHDFKKTKEFLVCVDSDGCAMDTMESKHRLCFAPRMLDYWEVNDQAAVIDPIWQEVNLYSATRGVNRFKALVLTLRRMRALGIPTGDFAALEEWAATAAELSNSALEKQVAVKPAASLERALAWSRAVNESIRALPDTDHPFEHVLEGLRAARAVADTAVVSSANGDAVVSEWTRHALAEQMSVLLGQEAGSKAACIRALAAHGYGHEQVIMLGDAPGDLAAAQDNGVLFYPILVGREGESWARFAGEALARLTKGTYAGAYQQERIAEFQSVLGLES